MWCWSEGSMSSKLMAAEQTCLSATWRWWVSWPPHCLSCLIFCTSSVSWIESKGKISWSCELIDTLLDDSIFGIGDLSEVEHGRNCGALVLQVMLSVRSHVHELYQWHWSPATLIGSECIRWTNLDSSFTPGPWKKKTNGLSISIWLTGHIHLTGFIYQIIKERR